MANIHQGPYANGGGAPSGGGTAKRSKAGASRPRRKALPQGVGEAPQEKGGAMNTAYIGIALTVFINLIAIAYNSGTVLTRIGSIEERVKEHTIKFTEVHNLDKQIGTLQAELRAISGTLSRLERVLSKEVK